MCASAVATLLSAPLQPATSVRSHQQHCVGDAASAQRVICCTSEGGIQHTQEYTAIVVTGLHVVCLTHAMQTAHHRAVAALLPGCTATATAELAHQLLVAQTLQTGNPFALDKPLDLTLYVIMHY